MTIETVYLAGGCYWGLQDLLGKIPGVNDTTVGFSGGHVKNVCYREVSTGTTGHAETVKVIFDIDILSFTELLMFFSKYMIPQHSISKATILELNIDLQFFRQQMNKCF